jgi:hypothetical protein
MDNEILFCSFKKHSGVKNVKILLQQGATVICFGSDLTEIAI